MGDGMLGTSRYSDDISLVGTQNSIAQCFMDSSSITNTFPFGLMKHRFNLGFHFEVLSRRDVPIHEEYYGKRYPVNYSVLSAHRPILPSSTQSMVCQSSLVHSDDHGQQCPHSVCQSMKPQGFNTHFT